MRLFGKEPQSEQGRRDEALRRKLEGHELTPPSYLWDAIEEKLPETKRRRPGALLYYVLPIAACLVAAIVLFITNGGKTTPEETRIAEKPATMHQEKAYADNSGTKQPELIEAPVAEDNSDLPKKTFTGTITDNRKNEKNPFVPTSKSGSDPSTGKKEKETTPDKPAVIENPVAKHRTPFVVSNENKPKEQEKITQPDDTANDVKQAPDIAPLVKNKTNHNIAGKWMAGLRISPGYNARYSSVFVPDAFSFDSTRPLAIAGGNYNEEITKEETGGSAFGVGLLAKYALTKNLSFITGLEYNSSSINSLIREAYYTYLDTPNQRTVSGEFVETSFGDMYDKNAGGGDPEWVPGTNAPSNAVITEKYLPVSYHFRVFEIPLALRAEFTGKRIGWFIEGGPRVRLLQSYHVTVYDGDVTTWRKESLVNVYNTVQAGMHMHTGIQVPLSQFTLEAGPHFNTMLSSINRQDENTLLYQAGGSLTAWYRF